MKCDNFILDYLELILDMDKGQNCVLCGNSLTFRYKAMREWNITGFLCGDCYAKKLKEHYLTANDGSAAKS